MTKEYLRMEKEGVPFEEVEKLTLGSLKAAVVDGDTKNGSMMAGQIAGLISRNDMSCAEIINEIMSDAEKLLKL